MGVPQHSAGSSGSNDWLNPSMLPEVAQRQSRALSHGVWLGVPELDRTAVLDMVLQNHFHPWGKDGKIYRTRKWAMAIKIFKTVQTLQISLHKTMGSSFLKFIQNLMFQTRSYGADC